MATALRNALLLAAALRVELIAYGTHLDATLQLKYTDIDYVVFTDASRYMVQGRSPFLRATYRYTPALSWALQPNVWLHPAFGKALFASADCLIGWLVHGMDREEAVSFGRVFRQNTVVFARDGRPEIIVTDPTADDIGRTFECNWRVRA